MRFYKFFILIILIFCSIFLWDNAISNDTLADFSSPEALYKTLVKAVKNKNIDLLWECSDELAKKVFGDTRDNQIIYMTNNFDVITKTIRISSFDHIEEHLDNSYFEAEIWMIREENGEKIHSSFYARRVNGLWKVTIPQIPLKETKDTEKRDKE